MSDMKRKSELESTYTKGPMRKDAFFGEYFVYNSIQGKSQIICVEKLFNDKESINREIDAKKKKILNKHDYIINLIDYSVEVQSNWCSTFYLLKTFYESPEKNLKKEILDRKGLSGSAGGFTMIELTHLLYQQVMANSFLQEKGVYHGDISPNTIFITNRAEFKLAFRINEQMTSERVQIDKSIKNEPLYLSPIVFTAVKNRTLERSRHNPHKADIFALGLAILEAGVMKSIQGIYGISDNFEPRVLDELLNDFEDKYQDNPLLFTSLRKMLEMNEEERPDFINLKSALPEYEVIKDYLYKLENGLIEDDPQDDSGGLNGSFNNDQNRGDPYGNGYYGQNQNQHQLYQAPSYEIGAQGYSNNNLGDDMGYNFYDDPPAPQTQNFGNGMQGGQNYGMNYGGQNQPNGSHPNNNFNGGNNFEGFIKSPSNNSENNSFNRATQFSQNQSPNPYAQPPKPVQAYNQPPVQNNGYGSQQQAPVSNQPTMNPYQPSPTKDNYQSDFFTFDYTTDYSINTNKPPQNQNNSYQGGLGNYSMNTDHSNPTNNFLGLNDPSLYNIHHQQPTPPQQSFNAYSQPTQHTNDNTFFYGNTQPKVVQAPQPIPQSQPMYAPPTQPSYIGQPVSRGSNPALGPVPTGNTKVISGKLYNEVREEVSEPGPSGTMVKKVIIKYVPADSQPTTVNYGGPIATQSFGQPQAYRPAYY
jgi:hypothetical protein